MGVSYTRRRKEETLLGDISNAAPACALREWGAVDEYDTSTALTSRCVHVRAQAEGLHKSRFYPLGELPRAGTRNLDTCALANLTLSLHTGH